EGVGAVAGGRDMETGLLEHLADEPAHADRVVDEEHAARTRSRGVGPVAAPARRGVSSRAAAAGLFHARPGIEPPGHAAVGRGTRAAIRTDPIEKTAERPNDDVLLVQDLVDFDRGHAAGAAHDENRPAGATRAALDAERVRERQQIHEILADEQRVAAPALVDVLPARLPCPLDR